MVGRIFARNFPNLPKKLMSRFLCEYFLIKAVFGMSSKKGLHVILGAIFSSQSTMGAIFACIFKEFAQIFTKSILGGELQARNQLGKPGGGKVF